MKRGEWFATVVLAAVLVAVLVALVLGVGGCDGLVPDPGESPLVAGVAAVAADAPEMTAEWILAVGAAVLSLALEVVPKLADKWNGLEPTMKRAIWLGGCLGIPLVILGAGCLGLDLGVLAPACGVEGVVESLRIGFAAYFASQAVYAVVAKRARVQRIGNG